jgi:hypothetical protein
LNVFKFQPQVLLRAQLIEILTRMSYIVSVGQTLGLDFSELHLQTSLLRTDVKKLGIDNGASLVKGLPVNTLRY